MSATFKLKQGILDMSMSNTGKAVKDIRREIVLENLFGQVKVERGLCFRQLMICLLFISRLTGFIR